jgi:hypothetical protein
MINSTKFLAVLAFATALAAPAVAQQAPRDTRENWGSRVHMYAADYYVPRHESRPGNPDYQLGSSQR